MNTKLRYTLYGAAFGLFFPVGAAIFEFVRLGLGFSIENYVQIHAENKIIFMIDSAPLFLGLFAFLGGISKSKAEQLITAYKVILDKINRNSEIVNTYTGDIIFKLKQNISKAQENQNQLNNYFASLSNQVETGLGTSNTLNTSLKSLDSKTQNLAEFNLSIKSANSLVHEKVVAFIHDFNNMNSLFQKINEITKNINILSINSGIEANKHGAAGKGFAVISKQIREFALNTSELNSDLIEQSEKLQVESELILEKLNSEKEVMEQLMAVSSEIENSLSSYKGDNELIINELQKSHHINSVQVQNFSNFKTLFEDINSSNQQTLEFLSELSENDKTIKEIIDKLE